MWIMTPAFGFLSVVQKPGDAKTHLTVRGRSRDHLEAFVNAIPEKERKGLEILEGAGTDYMFRVRVPRAIAVWTLMEEANNIDYSNFKSECGRRGLDSSWQHALHDIWDVHWNYQQKVLGVG